VHRVAAPPSSWKSTYWPGESAKNCIQCGECEAKCPDRLLIREMIVENAGFFESLRP
jgi:predicted aldo/keto reductase-like oxidoreductase